MLDPRWEYPPNLTTALLFLSLFFSDNWMRRGQAVRTDPAAPFLGRPHLFLVNLLKIASEEPNHSTPVLSDLQNLEQSLLDVISMIERVQTYVQRVVEGDIEGDPAIGRFLLDTLNTTTEGLEKGKLESLFNSHVQVRAELDACTYATDTECVIGHPHGHISGQPRQITGRSFHQVNTCNMKKRLYS
jgi:hypothetical protein